MLIVSSVKFAFPIVICSRTIVVVHVFPFSIFSICFCSPNHSASMKFAAFALLVTGVASASVSNHSSKQYALKERSNLKDATVGEVAAVLKLLARERPHQSFLQNDLEEVLGHKSS